MQHNVEESFNRFYKAVINQALNVRLQMAEELNEKKKKLLEQKELEYLEEAYRKIQSHVTKLNKETNEFISKSLMNCRKELLARREEIISEIMESVVSKIKDFINTPQYYGWLLSSCKKVLDLVSAGKDKVTLYVNHTDKKYIDLLKTNLENLYKDTSIEIKVCENEDFIGGVRAYNPESGILADDTIKRRMADAKNKFLKTSGLMVD